MRILVGTDQNPYFAYVVRDVAKLAMNTWADVTLVGVGPKLADVGQPTNRSGIKHPLTEALRVYRKSFFESFEEETSPYKEQKCGYEFVEVKKGVWEELYVCRGARKEFKIFLRPGNPVKEILAQANEDDSDLIVIGCFKEGDCQWEGVTNLPQKIANSAQCSVLVVKEDKKINRLVCCLDQENISQKSIELINQMVTLYQTDLMVVGLTEGTKLKPLVARNLDEIIKYYNARKIKTLLKLVEVSSLESFIAQEAKRSLMALWMGEQSIFAKFFPKSKLDKLIRGSESSVLLLR